jgi:hypothetical protein
MEFNPVTANLFQQADRVRSCPKTQRGLHVLGDLKFMLFPQNNLAQERDPINT